MSFKSILKAIGEDSLKVVKALEGGPTVIVQEIQSAEQKVLAKVTDLSTLVDLIKQAERMFAAAGLASSGSAKLAAITPMANGVIQDIEILGGTKLGAIIKDEPSFNDGVQMTLNGLVKCINACGK